MVEIESAGEQQYLADCLKSMYIIKVKSQTYFSLYFPFKALSHYNVSANVCQRMKNISSTLAFAEI